MAKPDRDRRPTADGDWRAADLAALRQERDALQAWLAAREGGPLAPQRQWLAEVRARSEAMRAAARAMRRQAPEEGA